MIISNQKTLLKFKKAQDLITKMIDMTERGERPTNIMQQNLSAIRFLGKGQKELMENYIASCFNSGTITTSGKGKREMTKEILKAVNLFNR